MPSDIARNPISQLPYLNQPFDMVRAEAEEAGFDIEHWDETNTIHTLQVRAPQTLIIRTYRGTVKAIGDGCWQSYS